MVVASSNRGLAVRTLHSQGGLDHLLYNTAGLLDLSAEQRCKISLEFLARSVRAHFDGCPGYRRLCDAEHFDPRQLACYEDLARIPLVPSVSFKRRMMRSVPEERIVKLCVSSGTQGSRSSVPRDHTTLERFLACTGVLVDELLEPSDYAYLFNLGPDAEAAGDLWLAYVLGAMELRFESSHYVRDGRLRLKELEQGLRAGEGRRQCILVGPPILFLHLLEYLEERGTRIDLGATQSFVVTAGGWKRFSGSAIPRDEFSERVSESLGLDASSVRDAYNMVELNTVLLECDHRQKHVPPWLVASARDASTLDPLPEGHEGLLAFLDSTADSYPGFVLSDDFGGVRTDPCVCGRTAPRVHFARRVESAEARGCALKMDRDVVVDTGDNGGADAVRE